jgi:hypothetical protein
MRFKLTLLFVVFLASLCYVPSALAQCVSIKDGVLMDSNGVLLTMGFDQFGYNYQAHIFRGTFDSSDRKIDGTYWSDTGDYVDDRLIMKWSDDWLSNVDCTGDGKLDRGGPGVTGTLSVGWLTNQVVGDYFDAVDSTEQQYEEFTKIVYMNLSRFHLSASNWYDNETNELIGPDVWASYCIIQDVYNDSGTHQHGVTWKSPNPGFGFYTHE